MFDAPTLLDRDRESVGETALPRSGLSQRSRLVCRAAVEALVADEDKRGEVVPAGSKLCDRVVHGFDQSIGCASSDVRRGMAALTLVLELLPLFLIGRWSRMSRLSIAERVRYFEALEKSSIGLLSMLFVAFKVPLCILAFEEGAELEATGFDRPNTSARRLPVRVERSPALRESSPT